jgi:hypothetical protein
MTTTTAPATAAQIESAATEGGWTITETLRPCGYWLGTKLYRDNANGTRDEGYATWNARTGKWLGMSMVANRVRVADSGNHRFGHGVSANVNRLHDAVAYLSAR